jgi:DNA sulfur modification protein DndD
MRISKLELQNIGPFVGHHELDLTTSKEKNIVLIGGKNGAGKTTILGSIKLGLFGARYYGYQSESKSYFNEVEKFLNTSQIKQKSNFGISVWFDVTASYQKNLYQLERSWTMTDKGLSEDVALYEQFDELKRLIPANEADELINKIFNEYPPRLIDSFVFDGEAINEMIRQDRLSEFLSQSFYSLFRLNMVNDLSTDLQNYIKNSKNAKHLNQEEVQLIEKRNEISTKKNALKLSAHKVEGHQNKIEQFKSEIDGLFSQFERLGGINQETKKALQFFLQDLERQRTKNSQRIRTFVEGDVFVSLLHHQIKDLEQSLISELPAFLKKHLLLANEFIGDQFSLQILLDELDGFVKEPEKYHNHKELLGYFKHDLSKVMEEHQEIQKLVYTSDVSHEELNTLRSRLNKAEELELQEYINQIAKLNDQIDHTEEQLRISQSENEILREELLELEANYEKVESEYKKKQKLTNSFTVALQVIEVLDLFRQKELERRLDEVSKLSLSIFSKTHGKKDFIKTMIITDYFSIQLESFKGHSLQLDKLSAGEKQLLVGSIIKAMFSLAKRKEFFLFDTPLARLDQSNRKSFIKNVISPMSDQVIILSTNEEITGVNFKSIQHQVERSYTLEYDYKTSSSSIKEGYDYERI